MQIINVMIYFKCKYSTADWSSKDFKHKLATSMYCVQCELKPFLNLLKGRVSHELDIIF
jgi:hypothetical protein